jgi:superfamily II DNA or RNA helicase
MTLTLRPYQTQLIEDIRAKWHSGARNVLAVMPTGAGKTVAFAALNADGERSCTIVHRQELVGQISKTYATMGTYHNIVAPQSVINFCIRLHIAATGRNFYDPRAAVSVAGVDTLIRRFKPGDAWCNSVRRWTLDEAHHGRQDNKWGIAAALFPNAKGLGVTATACRGDDKSLHADQGGLFHELVQGPGMRDLIDAGSLADYRVFAPQVGIDEALLQIGKTGDFTANSAKAAQKAEMIGDVVESYLTHIPGKQAIVFASGVQDAKDIAEQFRARGVPATALDGTNNDGHRMDQVARFETGETRILTNVDLFGEGFDVPACEAVIMARPTASFGLFVQQFGRALRPFEGKSHGVIIDHVGNVVRMAAKHGLPDTPRTWTLWQDQTRKTAGNPDAVPVRVCPECLLTYEAVVFKCPYCGAVHVPAGRSSPDQVDGVLSEMSLELLATLRAGADKIQAAEPAIPYGASAIVAAGIKARHRRNQAAQASLSDAMQRWGGMRLAAGDSDAAMQARFLFRFQVDVMSAQGLAERAALELRDAIMEATRQ